MWSLDAYRIAGVLPTGMEGEDLGALNRGKGDYFSLLVALLLQTEPRYSRGG